MAQIPTPPASRQGSEYPDSKLEEAPVADSADLLQSLDTLLERYLYLLDQHQKYQTELASRLSSGFFSLAQANYTCPPGRWYGADYYDERMKATRRVALKPPSSSNKDKHIAEVEGSLEKSNQRGISDNIFTIESVTNDSSEEKSGTNEGVERPHSDHDSTQNGSKIEGSDSTKQVAESLASIELSEAELKADPKPKSAKRKTRSSDPIRWYGVLVPHTLRSAQKSFTEAIEDPLPGLASVVFEMRSVEKEVARIRSELERV